LGRLTMGRLRIAETKRNVVMKAVLKGLFLSLVVLVAVSLASLPGACEAQRFGGGHGGYGGHVGIHYGGHGGGYYGGHGGGYGYGPSYYRGGGGYYGGHGGGYGYGPSYYGGGGGYGCY
jgi:hypothetical protein